MSDEVLEMIRKSYNSLFEKREKEVEKIKRIKQLEDNELVREYLDLTNSLFMYKKGYEILSDDDLIDAAFSGSASYITDTNKIYVCLGEYRIGSEGIFKRYVNVEKTSDMLLIPLNDSLKFEKENKVIFVSESDDYFNSKYREVQRDFLREAINSNQEEARRRVLSKDY